MLGERLIVLRNLVALGQVGIEVVLARKDRPFAHLAIQRQRGQHGKLHGLGIQYRERARQADAHGTNVGIRLRTKSIRAAAKNLARGEQLHVHFEADHRLVLGENVRG